MTLGRIVRSPDALRPMTLCNCDCKILTSAICRGLHWYTMQCIHTSQRCISCGQMTDNIFEIESTALSHVAVAPRDSGVLLTYYAPAYPSVNHAWIFSVLHILVCLIFSAASCEAFMGQHHICGICGSKTRTILDVRRSTTRLSCEWLSDCNGF